jgi:glyoxylase-like metal-dependent hydrolase (beta-lactamase superfamily II)
MALISPLYPHHSIALGDHVQALPADGCVPNLPQWRWIHTPGHTPGHISLFCDQDGALIAGDAFTTVKQESTLAVLTQEKEIHGPSKYFTTDWEAAVND